MRTDIANLREAYERETGLLRHIRDQRDVVMRSLEFMVREIRRICPESHLLPPGEMLIELVGKNIVARTMRIAPRPPIDSAPHVGSSSPKFTSQIVDVHALTSEVENEHTKFAQRVSVRIGESLAHSAIYISDTVFREKCIHPELREVVARGIAEQLMQHLMRDRGAGRAA